MANAKAASTNTTEPTINTLRADTCPTSSGKSILTYHIGCDVSGNIYLKVAGNDGGGMFSSEWVSFQDIQAAISEWPEGQGITSMTFRKIFRGKSANTPGFLVAVLGAVGLIEPMADKKRVHQACDPKAFKAEVSALQGGLSKKPKAKVASKKKQAPRAKGKSPTQSSVKTANTTKTPRKTTARKPASRKKTS